MIGSAQHQATLREMAGFEVQGAFEDNLYRLTCLTGELLGARRVSLMLLDTSLDKGTRLKLCALYGELPVAAWREEPAPGQGIAGQALARGQCVRVTAIERSPWLATARRPGQGGSFMACPIPLAGRPAGVLNISDPIDRPAFSGGDQHLAELAALFTGRAIHVARLERLLDSRFAQMAFALEGSTDACSVMALSAHEPERVAKMLAKGFYKEMRHCGFTPNQIIHAAGEIISELTGSLNRHARRMNKNRAE